MARRLWMQMNGKGFKHVSTRGELNQLEQANILEGMDWLKKQKSSAVLTEDFVRNLHQKLFGKVWKWAGSFRETERNIGVAPLQVANQLHQLLDDTRYWIEHETYPPKELAARFHHKICVYSSVPQWQWSACAPHGRYPFDKVDGCTIN